MLASMLRRSLILALIALAAPAHAADRSYVVTNFDRVRVDGPYSVQVDVGTGGGAAASASGDDRALGDLDISVNGSTLTVRKGSQGWGERGKASGPPPVITLRTPAVRGATVVGGARLALAGTLRTTRLDLQVTGAGVIDARGVDADDVVVTVIGNGNVALAGRTARTRFSTNGGGSIAATGLDAGEIVVTLEGAGETRASARYFADLTNKGLGLIAVTGHPKCTVRGQSVGPIECGTGAQP
jgi:hypothetical protein